MTRFGKGFQYLKENHVGDLLVLIPCDHNKFHAYVLSSEEDIEELQSALGVEVIRSWALYTREMEEEERAEDREEKCVENCFNSFCNDLSGFPGTSEFSDTARSIIFKCVQNKILDVSVDEQLLKYVDVEYRLFRKVEKLLCQDEIIKGFDSIDNFIETASRIMNRRKARAGRSLENHVEYILRQEKIPFDMRPSVDGKPDIIIPGKKQYYDTCYPISKIFIVGLKTTCKDRWRQVLNEAKRVPQKHILTLQQGISKKQLKDMHDSSVTLIVPEPLQRFYPRNSEMPLQNINVFLNYVRKVLSS